MALSEDTGDSEVSSSAPWTAPEAALYKKYTTKSDVWSYGMVMYEIWSLGHKPFEEFPTNEVRTYLLTLHGVVCLVCHLRWNPFTREPLAGCPIG